ncbi:DUF305 domain-containing protein [Catellatospora sp. KI3]|uniref:DUF305 domain-containing protein n=1 Tax=Catellatospora sp. KI3 TaxID=3041620 RepID=UPI0024823D1E|nr:DUF305 domain-containing protein [Catellatospora sp. KI3]MDI1463290.1 DUF305 domain-containing protein [Catellatospora sp. KI3]
MPPAARPITIVAAVLLGTAALTGCATSQSVPAPQWAGQPSPSQVSGTDVQFVQQMIANHEQVVQAAGMAAGQAASTELKQLATQIQQTYSTQLDQLKAWLTQKGLTLPSASPGLPASPSLPEASPGMPEASASASPGTTATPMPGLQQLQGLSGEQFDQAFVQVMSTLQQDALALVDGEISSGEDQDAKQLATQLQTTANATLQQLRQLAGGTPAPTPSPTS